MQTTTTTNNYEDIKYLITEVYEKLTEIERLIEEEEKATNEREQQEAAFRCQQREHQIWRELEKQRNKEFIEKQQKKAKRTEAHRRAAEWAQREYGS